jgi:2-polyprenyl-3-methyl-5-hydroxy-6-metoxy-1,4-benzoquinol methylase
LAGLGAREAVDLGCGRLRNLPVLEEHFTSVTLVDTEIQCQRVRALLPSRQGIKLVSVDEFRAGNARYDAVFLIAVLHTVDRPSVRKELLRVAAFKLRPRGFLVLDVPAGEHYYRVRCSKANQHGDGWAMGSGPIRTFYKSFNAKALDRLVERTESFELYERKPIGKHIVRIWRKLGPARGVVRCAV